MGRSYRIIIDTITERMTTLTAAVRDMAYR